MHQNKILFLLTFLLFKCGFTPAEEQPSSPTPPVAEVVITTELESGKIAQATAALEEESDPLMYWDSDWPAITDQKDRSIKADESRGLPLNRVYVTDTIYLNRDLGLSLDFGEVNAVFVSLIDFVAGENSAVNAKINNHLLSLIDDRRTKGKTPRERLTTIAKKHTRAFQRERTAGIEKQEEDYFTSFREAISTTILHNDSTLLMLSLGSYEFRGGAGGDYYINDLTFFTETGQLIKMKDVISPDKRSDFLKSLFALALAEGNIDDSSDPALPLPDNYRFTNEGVAFNYPEYSGLFTNHWAVSLTMPYETIEPMLSKTGKTIMGSVVND